MAPELTEKPESVSSDIYALGIVLYQALTGQLPFQGTTPISICWKHLHEPPAPPSQLNPGIPYAVEQVILRALEKDPHRRFQSAREMAQAYQRALTFGELPADDGLDVVLEDLAPAHVEVKKQSATRQPLTHFMVGEPVWQGRLRKVPLRLIACIAVLLMFVAPLTLGIILGKDGDGVATQIAADASVNLGAAPLRPMRPLQPAPTPTAVPAQTATPTSYNVTQSTHGQPSKPTQPPEPTQPPKHHAKGHGHRHGPKHGHPNH
jgi:serine/threonine protein kinase